MFRHAANLALLLIFTHATSTLAADPTNLSISARRIDAVFKDFSRETPGCALGLYRRGKVIYAKGYGMADLGLGVPITPATVFDIGSTSKQFAAAALLLLVQDGKVSLSDDVHRYIPELPEYSQSITVDQLLRHTSGLRDYNGLLYTAGHFFEDFTNDDDALSIIAAQHALNFAPGSEWDYTNTGYFLVSVIVKRVSGKSLAEFSKERLFTPLGMTVTHFRTDHTAVLANRATAYSARPKGGYAIEMSNWDQTGDGGINTNVTELAKWDGNFYDGRVGGRALVDALEQPGR
ncbi:MAG: serine hydrolase, partial [Proteobacteria bacterium]|nr:serine hydrolase [Pseudomonadota bacterium]